MLEELPPTPVTN